jgi:hypothetical protein
LVSSRRCSTGSNTRPPARTARRSGRGGKEPGRGGKEPCGIRLGGPCADRSSRRATAQGRRRPGRRASPGRLGAAGWAWGRRMVRTNDDGPGPTT